MVGEVVRGEGREKGGRGREGWLWWWWWWVLTNIGNAMCFHGRPVMQLIEGMPDTSSTCGCVLEHQHCNEVVVVVVVLLVVLFFVV